MLEFFLVLAGLLIILFVEEFAWRKKILKGEAQRKFGHISLGIFAAFWPWLISWNQLKLLGALAIVFTLVNRFTNLFHYLGVMKRGGWGDIYYAVALLSCSFLTTNRLFFCLAILQLGVADGLAAVIGNRYGKRMAYKISGSTKTVLGSASFWLSSLSILAIGLLFAPTDVNPSNYAWLIIFLPLMLVVIENISPLGLDNLSVPIITLAILTWLN